MTKKKVLLISDSLALPRLEPEDLPFEDTFYAKLCDAFNEVQFITVFQRGATLSQLVEAASFYTQSGIDLVVVQSGVVDCAPRAFSRIELKALQLLKLRVPKKLVKFLRKNRGLRYTSAPVFKNKIQQLQNAFGNAKVFWFPILPAMPEWEEKVPGVTKSVAQYNAIIKECLQEKLLLDKGDSSWLMADYHHLNAKGHNAFYKTISEIISR